MERSPGRFATSTDYAPDELKAPGRAFFLARRVFRGRMCCMSRSESEASRAKRKFREKQWVADNPDRVREIKAKSAAKKKAEDPRRIATSSKEYRDCNPRKIRELRLRYYGVTPDQFDILYSQQNGLCSICQKDIPAIGNGRHLDHCHKTNVIRGILCAACNLGLGAFRDNPESLRKAAGYLETANTGFVVANPARLNRPNAAAARRAEAKRKKLESNT